MTKSKSGFTIVELLIVIVVIGILAAITIVAYNGIQNRTYDGAVKSDLRNLGVKVREYMVLNDDAVPAASQVGLESFAKASKSAYQARSGSSLVYCRTANEFAFIAQSRSGAVFIMENGTTRKLGSAWGGSDDNNACGSNTTIGLVYGADSGYAYINLYRNSIWQSWVSG